MLFELAAEVFLRFAGKLDEIGKPFFIVLSAGYLTAGILEPVGGGDGSLAVQQRLYHEVVQDAGNDKMLSCLFLRKQGKRFGF